MQHSEGFKARMVQRMAGPEGISATRLSREVGVAQPTLSRWLREATLNGMSSKPKGKGSSGSRVRSWEEKLEVVLKASALSDEELGAFLRHEGVHEAQLREWREAVASALKPKPGARKRSPEARRIRELEKELRRKDAALAEAAALLTLSKKVRELWGDEDDDTRTKSGI